MQNTVLSVSRRPLCINTKIICFIPFYQKENWKLISILDEDAEICTMFSWEKLDLLKLIHLKKINRMSRFYPLKFLKCLGINSAGSNKFIELWGFKSITVKCVRKVCRLIEYRILILILGVFENLFDWPILNCQLSDESINF